MAEGSERPLERNQTDWVDSEMMNDYARLHESRESDEPFMPELPNESRADSWSRLTKRLHEMSSVDLMRDFANQENQAIDYSDRFGLDRSLVHENKGAYVYHLLRKGRLIDEQQLDGRAIYANPETAEAFEEAYRKHHFAEQDEQVLKRAEQELLAAQQKTDEARTKALDQRARAQESMDHLKEMLN